MYRTFHNVVHNANLSLNCLLKALEDVYRTEHHLPDVLYYQVNVLLHCLFNVLHYQMLYLVRLMEAPKTLLIMYSAYVHFLSRDG